MHEQERSTQQRLPLSRAWAQAGFGVDAAEDWRRGGWSDPAEAARWRDARPHSSPASLRRLFLRAYEPSQVARVGRFSDTLAPIWTEALLGGDTVIDLRDGAPAPDAAVVTGRRSRRIVVSGRRA